MSRKILPAAILILFAAPGCPLLAQAQAPPRIVEPVTESVVARLWGTTHRLATPATRIGRAPADLPMERILLNLKRSPIQQIDLDQLLADLQNPGSDNFHRWLTPEQFGQRFGPGQQDIGTITAWLQSHGFHVNEIAKGRNTVEFSGTAQQVETAFRTEIHRYRIDEEEYTANSTDIAIPVALQPVVSGVVSLHSFPRQSFAHARRSEPLGNVGSGHVIAPYDFAAIYNVAPLWTGGFDGAGQTIAIPGRSAISFSDVATFRSTFGLPANAPRITFNGANPGLTSSETEADLDVQWAGAVAKGATVQLIVSKSTATTDGVDLSSLFAVNDNAASVVSLSFGSCEAHLNNGNQFYYDLWAQAAAQGMSVFVSSGDSGSAGCDPPRLLLFIFNVTSPATEGLVVNGLASTPYNVAVGGTQFNDVASPSTYWNQTNDTNQSSARGYIPELVWNESSYSGSLADGNSLFAGGGGVSSLYPTPAWQTGRGVPTEDPGASGQHHRYLPDVSLSGSLHDGYQVYQGGTVHTIGGTSASAPAMAGIMAIVNQYTKGRNGNPNPYFYRLASRAPSVYHDINSGTNAVPCVGGSPNCSTAAPAVGVLTGFRAGAGFDLATGWGSVDAAALVQNWTAGGPPSPVIASISPNPMSASAAVQNLIINGTGFLSGATVKVGSATFGGSQITYVGSAQLRIPVTGRTPGDQAVQVINPDGSPSNTVNLQVVAPGPPPVITGLLPNPLTGSNSPQVLTISGTGFVGGLTLQVGSTTYNALQLQSLSATQIQKSRVFTTASRSLSVKVTNPDGQSSETVELQVQAPLGQFAQQGAKLVGNDAAGAAAQGHAVAISGDGQTAILGGNSDAGSTGAAWIFSRVNGVWVQRGTKLIGDGAAAAQQGASVAISGDGNTAIVGGPADNNLSGAAWIFTRSGDVWTQQGPKLVGAASVGAAQQGRSVALSGDGNTAVVGGHSDNGNAGAAWVYTRSDGVWTPQGAKLVGTGAAGSAQQGSSLAISADGNTVIVDGIADNSSTSANWVYTRSNGVWTQQGPKLVGGGGAVALSADGSTAIAGATARAVVFTRSNGVWSAGTSLRIGTARTSAGISGDGNTAVVGSSQYGAVGAAWIFKRNNGTWSQFGERLVGADAGGVSLEGYSVAMSSDGITALVGDPQDAVNTGAGWVFALATGPQIDASGITNAAATLATLARGGLAIAYGSSLAAPGVTAQAGTIPYPLTLGGSSLTVAGIPAPLYSVNSRQINFQVPFEVPPGSSADVVVVNADGVASAPVSVAMADYAVGLYGYFRTPSVYDPMIRHLDGQLVTPSNPAMPAERLTVTGTGIGKLTATPKTGAATPTDPPASAVDAPEITVGGVAAQVIFAGLTPGAVGQIQLDFALPATLPPSPSGVLPLAIQFPDDSVPPVNLYLQPTPTPDLLISKRHAGSFTQGQSGAAYTITVNNFGSAGTNGTIAVVDTLPAGLSATAITGGGWTCTQPSGPCSREDVLGPGAGFPAITLTVNVALDAPAIVTNTATVAGGGEFDVSNNTTADPTIVTPLAAPDLTVIKTHTGNFTPGQTGAIYTITAANIGTGPTTGTVSVSDLLPAGLTATSIAGSGWTCTQPYGPCTRSDVLASGGRYPVLLLAVNVAANAPAAVANVASVSGGGETNTGNNIAVDTTAIAAGGGGGTGGTYTISALAGTGVAGFSGDGGPATAAQVNLFGSVVLANGGLAVDLSGTIYLADASNHRVRKITTAGTISTFAGTGVAGFSGDGGPALSAKLNGPAGLAFDTLGNLYIADSENGSVRKVTPAGVISTIAGTGSPGLGTGDGGPATSATMYRVYDLAFDRQGNLYMTDTFNNRVRKVNAAGIMSTFAGTGRAGFSGDGGQAAAALLREPYAVTADAAGNVYIVDAGNNRVRRVAPGGIITTFAGNGSAGFGGDGGPATSAPLPFSDSGLSGGLVTDAAGNLYIADSNNGRIRKVTSAGLISTIAGSGSPGSAGDGGPALSARMSHPTGLALGSGGSLLFADVYNSRFRKLTPVAGTGTVSLSEGGQDK